MKLILVLSTLCFLSIQLNAQHFKLSATQGLAYDNNKNNDSLFFANNYNVTQLRVGYHYGKLGIISNINYINQVDNKDSFPRDNREPLFLTQQARKYANVQSINTTLGLELCVPIIKRKAQLNFYVSYGLSFSKSDSVVFYDANLIAYHHKASGKLGGCFQTGLSFNYKLNPHFGLKWQNEFTNYKLNYNAVDIRQSSQLFVGVQNKNLIVSSIGVQYTF
jgi:hypothetical protein